MNAQVLENIFTIDHNTRETITQEYELAKQHFREVCRYRNSLYPEHNKRFQDAADRLDRARERWLETLR